jgi:hypothetical protein
VALPVGEPQLGLIAQEVAKVLPETVTAPRPGGDGAYSLKEDKLIPALVEAIKEQQAEIEALRRQMAGRRRGKHGRR